MSSLYKRDTSFNFCDNENRLNFLDFQNCEKIETIKSPLIYRVDKIDDYILQYDVLPTIGGILVSSKFKMVFNAIEDIEVQYIPVIIRDKQQQECNNFFCLNILSYVSVLDRKRSVFLPYEWADDDDDEDVIDIIQPFYYLNNMGTHLIVRMEEDKSFIIVSELFKEMVEKNKLKGISLDSEGDTIYTDIGLTEAREKMKQIYI